VGGEGSGALLQQAWEDLRSGFDSLSPEQLLAAAAQESLRRVFGAHDCRLFGPTAVRFACRCSNERVSNLVRSLGAEEARAALASEGALTVTCEFCGRDYRYDAVDIAQLFAADGRVQPPPGGFN